MIYISATLACIATLLKKAVSHSHMTFSWASCSQWNLRTFQTEQKLNFQEMPLSTLIQPPPLLPNQANLLNLRTHYSNQPQRTLVLDNLSNQREICQDLLNGQNTLDYKDKRRSCLSD